MSALSSDQIDKCDVEFGLARMYNDLQDGGNNHKKACRCRHHPIIFKIDIYFAIPSLRLDTSINSPKYKAMTRVL